MPCGRSGAVRHAVLDTNILVSALIRPEGPPGQVMAAVKRGELVPVFSRAVFAEYEEVLRRPRLRLEPEKVDAALDTMRAVGTVVQGEPPAPPAGLPDGSDWPFIACAQAAGCPVITGNAQDFPAPLGVRVMTAREWVEGAAV
jgi:putative PIN family toxin of toxin-antitoxin system